MSLASLGAAAGALHTSLQRACVTSPRPTDFPVCGSSAEECEQAWGRSRDRYTVSGQVYPVLSMHGRGSVLTSACSRAQWVGYTPSESARASFDETKEGDSFSEGARHESAGSNQPHHRGASEAAGQDIVVRVSHIAKRSSTPADRWRNVCRNQGPARL
eukprot:COSAG01_NODE_210_length_21939_cov_32.062096_1_plen_159_part_00